MESLWKLSTFRDADFNNFSYKHDKEPGERLCTRTYTNMSAFLTFLQRQVQEETWGAVMTSFLSTRQKLATFSIVNGYSSSLSDMQSKKFHYSYGRVCLNMVVLANSIPWRTYWVQILPRRGGYPALYVVGNFSCPRFPAHPLCARILFRLY